MLENMVFVFGDVRQDAPMKWWNGKYVVLPREISDGTALLTQGVWRDQFMIMTERRFESLETLDRNLNFGAIQDALHFTNWVNGKGNNKWIGVKFESMEDWFKLHVNCATGQFYPTDMSDKPLVLSEPLSNLLKKAVNALL